MELAPSSSRDGEKNALRNNVTNIEFVNAKVEDFVEEYREKVKDVPQKTTIILDPPRDGLHPSALPHILSLGADEIIYVSCNPGTLVRDVATLIGSERFHPKEEESMESDVENESELSTQNAQGVKKLSHTYRITDITPVDMFPHTHHIETVVRLEKITLS